MVFKIDTKKLVRILFHKNTNEESQYVIVHSTQVQLMGIDCNGYLGLICLFKKKDGDWLRSKPMIANLAKKLATQWLCEVENATFWAL